MKSESSQSWRGGKQYEMCLMLRICKVGFRLVDKSPEGRRQQPEKEESRPSEENFKFEKWL